MVEHKQLSSKIPGRVSTMSNWARIPKENKTRIVFTLLPEEQQATEESLIELERVIAATTRKNEHAMSLSEELASRTSLC